MILDAGQSIGRDAGFEIGALLWRIHAAAGKRRFNKRRANAVAPDPMWRKLDRHGLGQAFYGVFGHTVDGAIGGSDMAHPGYSDWGVPATPPCDRCAIPHGWT